MNMQGSTLHTGQNQKSSVNIDWSMVDAVLVSKWCTTKIKVREKTKHTMCPRLGSLEEVQIPLLDDQRHCDTVLSTKTFF